MCKRWLSSNYWQNVLPPSFNLCSVICLSLSHSELGPTRSPRTRKLGASLGLNNVYSFRRHSAHTQPLPVLTHPREIQCTVGFHRAYFQMESGAPGAASLSNLTVATGLLRGWARPGWRRLAWVSAVNSSVQSTHCGVCTQDTVQTASQRLAQPTSSDISPWFRPPSESGEPQNDGRSQASPRGPQVPLSDGADHPKTEKSLRLGLASWLDQKCHQLRLQGPRPAGMWQPVRTCGPGWARPGAATLQVTRFCFFERNENLFHSSCWKSRFSLHARRSRSSLCVNLSF